MTRVAFYYIRMAVVPCALHARQQGRPVRYRWLDGTRSLPSLGRKICAQASRRSSVFSFASALFPSISRGTERPSSPLGK